MMIAIFLYRTDSAIWSCSTDIVFAFSETPIEFHPSGKHGWAQIMMKNGQYRRQYIIYDRIDRDKNKPDLIDEPHSKEAIRASDPIVELPQQP